MKFIGQLILVFLTMSVTLFSGNAFAQSKADSLFSHKGFKFNFGLGETRVPSEDSFDKVGWGDINLGYGISSRSTFWLGVKGGEVKDVDLDEPKHFFGGLELTYQYKFISDASFQPYGKIGFGAYGIGFDDNPDRVIAGGGLTGAVGFDYFFSKRFGIGLELNLKDIVMVSETIKVNGGDDVERDLEPHLNRDSRTLMVTFTIQ